MFFILKWMEKKGEKSIKIAKDNLFHSNFFLETKVVTSLSSRPFSPSCPQASSMRHPLPPIKVAWRPQFFNQKYLFFRTDFKVVYPYDPRELIAFSGIGVVCGLGGALYVYTHRRYVLWMRGNKRLTKFLQKNRFIYPFIISFLITAVTFPNFLGQFIASKLNTHDQVYCHDIFWDSSVVFGSPNIVWDIKHVILNSYGSKAVW